MWIDLRLQSKVIQAFYHKSTSFADTFSDIFSKTFAEFDSPFLSCMLAFLHNIDSSRYSLIQFPYAAETMLPSIYVEFDTVLAAKGCASFKSNACSWEINCASKGAEFTQNTKLLNSNTSGYFVYSTFLNRKRWYFQFWGASPILKLTSAISHTKTTRYILNFVNTAYKSPWNFGPWCIASFRQIPLVFDAA